MSKLINALSLVALVGSTTATVAGAVNPKAGAVVAGAAGVAAALSEAIIKFKSAGSAAK